MSINKNKEFHKWLSTCPFRICKMDFITHGLTSVSFVWHEEDEEEQLDDKYQSIMNIAYKSERNEADTTKQNG